MFKPWGAEEKAIIIPAVIAFIHNTAIDRRRRDDSGDRWNSVQ
jgi:hypothetical protein